MNSYPPLRLAVLSGLQSIKEHLEGDPDYLEDENCPYDPETKAILKELLATRIVEKIIEKEVESKRGRGRPSKDVALSDEDQATVKEAIKELIDGLNEMGTGEGLATNERIQITKTKTALVEQLLKMQERAFNVKRMSEFMETVIAILDGLIDEKGREQMMKMLEPFR